MRPARRMPSVHQVRRVRGVRGAGAALAAAAVLLAGCGGDDEASEAAADGSVVLRTVDVAFEPSELTVPAGQELRIVNDDELSHTVTARDGSFDVVVAAGDEARLTMNRRGSFAFACELHPQMTGRLQIE